MASKIDFTCPYCETYYLVYDGIKPMALDKINDLSEIVRKQYDLGYCKACQRKDPDVPTTLEMDGLYSHEDILNRFYVMRRCASCNTWNKIDTRDAKQPPCTSCNNVSYDVRSTVSIRTWNPNSGKKKLSKSDNNEQTNRSGKDAWNDPQFIKQKYVKK